MLLCYSKIWLKWMHVSTSKKLGMYNTCVTAIYPNPYSLWIISQWWLSQHSWSLIAFAFFSPFFPFLWVTNKRWYINYKSDVHELMVLQIHKLMVTGVCFSHSISVCHWFCKFLLLAPFSFEFLPSKD